MSGGEIGRAARAIRAGGIIAYPTESCYGLGCDPLNRAAVLRLLKLKRRPAAKGLILIAYDRAQLRHFARELPGPPVRLVTTIDGRITTTMELVTRDVVAPR